MRYLGTLRLGSLRFRDRVLPPAERPWLTDLSALCPYPGLEPGNLPEFATDPDWSAWRIGDTPMSREDALIWLGFETPERTLLVADRMLMSRVSWADLEAGGYVHGRDIVIDGATYRIRLLTGGKAAADDPIKGAAEPNEWDRLVAGQPEGALTPCTEDHAQPLSEAHRNSAHNALWHWFGAVSWVADTSAGRADGRVCRGYHGPQFFYENTIDHRHEDIGWRPVLEAALD